MPEFLKATWGALFHLELLGTDLRTCAAMLFLLVLSALIWITWFLWLSRQSPNLLLALVGAGLLCMAQIIATELGVGLLRALYPPVLLTTNLGLTAVILFLGVWPARTKILARQREWAGRLRQTKLSWFIWALLLLLAVVVARSIIQGLFLPPREWDALVYHDSIVAYFYQAHAIEPLVSAGVRTTTYPFDGELLALWNLMFLGLDKLVDLAALPGILSGGIAVYGIARHWGASRDGAAAGAALFAFAPTLVIQQVSAHGDALMASLFAMGAFCLLTLGTDQAAGGRTLLLPVLAGTAIGLTAAIKYAGLFYAAGMAVLFILKVSINARQQSSPVGDRGQVHIVYSILVAAALALALGGYPYLRNIAVFRNPLAPFNVRLAGHTIFTGERETGELITTNTPPDLLKTSLPERLLQIWREPSASIEDETTAGLGPLWFVLGLPCLLTWAVYSVARKRWEQILIMGVVLLAYFATPAFWVPRYGLPIVVLGALALGWVFDRLRGRLPQFLRAEVLLGACYVVFLTMDMGRVEPRVLRDYVARRTDYTRSSADFAAEGREVLLYIQDRTRSRPARITYSGLVQFVYPLYGPDFHNTVIYLPPTSEREWQRLLDQDRIDLVVTVPSKPQYKWISEDAEFRSASAHGGYYVFARR